MEKEHKNFMENLRELVSGIGKKPSPDAVPSPTVSASISKAPTEAEAAEKTPQLWLGCADVHTPHFGVTHTPKPGERELEE